jgi:hypothetical protein
MIAGVVSSLLTLFTVVIRLGQAESFFLLTTRAMCWNPKRFFGP